MGKFDSIEMAIDVLSKGGIVIVSDDEDRENEGDFVAIAELITPETINFMITHGKGLVCLPISKNIAKRLNLPLMVEDNTESHKTAFTVSIDAHEGHGVSTGISAWDRYQTIQLVTKDTSKEDDFVRPGHIFPLIAEDEGVLKRTGHTEASVDLAELAGYQRAAVIVEIILPNGEMARQKDLFEMKRLLNIPYITISDLREYIINRKESYLQLESI